MSEEEYYGAPLIRRLIESDAVAYNGLRKIVQGVDWEITRLPNLTYADIGYGKNKQRQLERNYVNADEFARVRAILDRRRGQSFTSVGLSMRGATKDSRSQGHCMLSIVITRVGRPRLETVEVQYRSTEAIFKFGGDVCFFPWVFERLGLAPDRIRFHFANAYLSGVFFPTLMRWWEPIDFLELLWRKDRTLFRPATKFLLRSSSREDQHFPYSPENQQHRHLWRTLRTSQIRRIHDYVKEKLVSLGESVKITHHTKDYVPRNKREENDE